MAALYSSTLWADAFTDSPGGTSDPVPEGVIWVVRDIAWNPIVDVPHFVALGPEPLMTITVEPGDVLLWGAGTTWLTDLNTFQWKGRQVMTTGQYLQLNADMLSHTIRVMGYVLTAP